MPTQPKRANGQSKTKKDKQKGGKPARSKKKTGIHDGMDDVAAALYQDALINYVLPSASYEGGYTKVERTLRTIPVAGAAASELTNGCSVTLNPWYAGFNYVTFQKMLSSVVVVANIPSVFFNGGTSTTVVPNPGTQVNTSFLQARNTAAGVDRYSGYVRVIGVEVDIEYTGTLLNAGGFVTIHHGGGRNGGVISNSDSANGFEPAYTTFSAISADTTRTTQIRFDKKCKFVWRPGHCDFVPVRTYRENDLQSAAVVALVNDYGQDMVGDILAPNLAAHQPISTPWGCHFNVTLAAPIAAGASMPIILRIRCITDEAITLDNAGGVDLGYPIAVATHRSMANTQKLDKYRNALSGIHEMRSKNVANDSQRPLSIFSTMKSGAASAAKDVAAGFLTKAGESIF